VVIPNPLWRDGGATSIRSAVLWAAISRCDALAIVLCDQARLTAAHIDALCAAYRLTRRSIASLYGDTIGVPAVFDKIEFPKLLDLDGDTGLRRVLLAARCAAVEWSDTPADLAAS
jgi:molybdenum cofactor cytidylyltransferase